MIPPLSGPVIDQAGILSASTENRLDSALRDLNEKGTMQLQVLTLQSLEGLPIEEATIQIFDRWKLGDKSDKGVLFLIVPSERKMRIEVGRGLEGEIPDITAKRIIADVVTPYFQDGRYDDGVVAGVVSIARKVDPQAFSSEPVRSPGHKKGIPVWAILLILLVLIFRSLGGGGRRYYGGGFGRFGGGFGGGGFGGGGGWSGGGGMSNGGGASGNW